jgi:glycosyltransferase involved in cell wall biosynthesis
MRILIVSEVFYPVIGGAGKTVYTIAESLTNKGHKVYILARKTKGTKPVEKMKGFEVYRIVWPNNFVTQLFSFCNIYRFVKRFLSENSLDLIICNQPFSAFSVYFATQSRDIPNIYHFHSSWPEEFQIKKYIQDIKLNSVPKILRFIIFVPLAFFMRKIEGFVVTHYDKIIVVSQYSKEKLIKFYGLENIKIKKLPGFVNTEKFKPAKDKLSLRNRLKIPTGCYILITARNLVERMGIDNLILAFNNLCKTYKDLYLLIVGDGRLKKSLIKLAEKLNISSLVEFTGQLEEYKLIQYLQASNLFILPTKYIEHFGLVTVEALATGIPVLGTPIGATPEILNKLNKDFLFRGTDVDSITEGIKQFLNKYRDKNLQDICREFAIREYSLKNFANLAERIYLDIIERCKNIETQK